MKGMNFGAPFEHSFSYRYEVDRWEGGGGREIGGSGRDGMTRVGGFAQL